MTGETPAVLLIGRNIRTRLDALKSSIRKRAEEKQHDQEMDVLDVGQAVVTRDYRGGNKWVPGIITAHSVPLYYEVRVAPNTVWRRHIDQLRESAITVNPNMTRCRSQTQQCFWLLCNRQAVEYHRPLLVLAPTKQ